MSKVSQVRMDEVCGTVSLSQWMGERIVRSN